MKLRLVERCITEMDSRIKETERQLEALKADVAGESKSSAGDKHETARAMMNLEQEKLGKQLNELLALKDRFDKIDFSPATEVVKMGSLVTTSMGIFLMSVGLGKLSMGEIDFFLLSPQSPLGESLLGKSVGETIFLNANKFLLIEME